MKKQIAVLMAAATAVTTVAPAIANADVTEYNSTISEVTAAAKKALNDKYENGKANGITIPTNSSLEKDYLNSKFVVLVENKSGIRGVKESGFKTVADSAYNNYPGFRMVINEDKEAEDVVIGGNGHKSQNENKWLVVDDSVKLNTLIENNLDKDLKVAIISKGFDGGSSIRTTTNKHYVVEALKNGEVENDQEVNLTETANVLRDYARIADKKDVPSFVDTLKVTMNGNEEKYVDDKDVVKKLDNVKFDDVTKIKVKLTSGVELTLEENDDAFKFEKGLDKDGNVIKTFTNDKGQIIMDGKNTQDVMDKIVSFEKIENKDDKSVELDIPNGDTDVYTVKDVTEEVIELKNIYTREDGYNKEGELFVNGIVKSKRKSENYLFNFRGVNYQLKTKDPKKDIHLDDAKIDKTADGYKLTLDVDVRDYNDKEVTKTLRFEIFGEKQKDLFDVLRDLNGEQTVVSGHFTKLAGADRYETAIAVSQEQFDPETADSVVIVGGRAQLDGLSAAPLATAKNAPILLADPNNGLSKATLDEIDRACTSLKNKTVYIIGGENSVPASVEKQLEEKFNAVVLRVAGADRTATSLEVARRLQYDGQANNRLFLVGKDGAPDAMTASSVAAKVEEKAKKVVTKNTEEWNTPTAEEGKNAENKGKDAWDDAAKAKADADAKAKKDMEDAIVAEHQKVVDQEKAYEDAYAKEYGIKKGNRSVKVSPILVVDKAGLDRTTRDFIKKDLKSNMAYLIGGESSLSTQVVRDARLALKSGSVLRVAGKDRYATNVEVIKTFFANDKFDKAAKDGKIIADGAIFASGKTEFLVDAQTSGAFAASIDAPIVLTDKELTKDQVDFMKAGGVLENQRTNIYQVGGVVSADVMKVVVDKLDL